MSRMKLKRIMTVLSVSIAMLLGTIPAVYSADDVLPVQAEYDGYIVSAEINPFIASLAGDMGNPIEPIVEDKGLYFAEDMAEVERLKMLGKVNYVEPNYIATLCDLNVDAEVSESGWGLGTIAADVTLKNGYLGDGVKVGVIDSGLNKNHIEFSEKNITGYDYYYTDYGFEDSLGHGTFVSGIIASGLNDTGMVGVAPNAELVVLKAFAGENTNTSTIVRAIYGGVDSFECDVLNMSFAFTSNPATLQNAIDYAISKGVIVVAAVGNGTSSNLNYPAAYSNVIGVGSIQSDKKVYARSVKNQSVFAAAPGATVKSVNYSGNDTYKSGTGTSYATPYVTGMVAVLKSIDNSLDVGYAKEIIMNTSEDIDAVGYDINSGYGLVNVQAAVEYLLKDKEIYQNKLYTKLNENTLFTNSNVIYRGEEKADLIIALKNSDGMIWDIKLYDITGSEFKNFEYEYDISTLDSGKYRLEYYMLGRESLSPFYERAVFEFEKE